MNWHRKFITSAYVLMVILFTVNCGSISSVSSSSTGSSTTGSSTTSTQPAVGENVSQLTITDAGVEINLSDVDSSDDVMLVLFNNNTSSTSEGLQVGESISDDIDDMFLVLEEEDDIPADEIEGVEDVTGEFHLSLREQENALDEDAILEPSEFVSQLVKFATVGSERDFKVINSFSNTSSYTTVTATLRYSGSYFNFYVDNRDESSLTDDELESLADDFEAVIPLERELFGEESDVDGDGKFNVLFTRVVNEIGGSAGGIVTGFFYAVDLFDDSVYPTSNETEVYYTFVPDPNGDHGVAISKSFSLSNILPAVLPHEYQHMISFNQHYFENGGPSENGWLNEGLSHLAEDIYNTSGNYMTSTGVENPSRVATYLSYIDSICFVCGTSLSQRGGSYLFIRYLYEQAELGNFSNSYLSVSAQSLNKNLSTDSGGISSGKELLNALLNTSNRGITNIVKAIYGSNATSDDFKTLMGQFSLAVYLNDFQGINLRSSQDDNRGTVLNGPAVQEVSSFPYVDTVSGNSLIYLQMSGSTVLSSGGTIPLSFGDGSDFGGYVVRE